jgi:hypothetical protein
VWLKEFKFLGIVFNPFDRILRSMTRKGRSLSLDLTVTKVYDELGIYRLQLDNFFQNSHYSRLGERLEIGCLHEDLTDLRKVEDECKRDNRMDYYYKYREHRLFWAEI